MKNTLEKEVRHILDSSDLNELPIEERKRICKYKAQQQILTLYQVLNLHKSNTTEAWRAKIRAWLQNCIDLYKREYLDSDVNLSEYPTDRDY